MRTIYKAKPSRYAVEERDGDTRIIASIHLGLETIPVTASWIWRQNNA